MSLDDATVASRLVCGEIARFGASPAAHFRVSVGKLGSAIILSVTERYGESGDQTHGLRVMRVESLQAVPEVAPRIARAIVLDLPVEEPPRTEPAPQGEEREQLAASGHQGGTTHFAIGFITLLAPPDRELQAAPGIDLDVHFETGDGAWEMGGDLRLGAKQGDSSIAFAALGGGVKYFTSRAEASPYVGGGFMLEALELELPGLDFSGTGFGAGAYVDAGVEVFRRNHTHLAFGARLDLPFFAIANNNFPGFSSVSRFYYAPLAFEARLTL